MAMLLGAALFWLALHLGVAGTGLREVLVRRLGEWGFRATFSTLSALGLIWLATGFRQAPTQLLWVAPDGLRWVLLLVMLPAFLLFFGAVLVRSPTTVGARAGLPARGMLRVTRHPMLWSFVLWATVHIAGNGDTAALVFFGTLAVTALAGMPSIDAKVARRDPAGWRDFSRATSILPFGAILAGRTALSLREIGWLAPALAVLAWGLLLHLHLWLFGVSPLPMG